MIKRQVCFFSIVFLLVVLCCRVVGGMQWRPPLHPAITDRKAAEDISISGQVYQKKQQSEKQILYISNKKSKTIIYNKQIQNIHIGDIITVRGALAPFDKPRNPGNFNQEFYYHKEGIGIAVFAEQVEVIDRDSRSCWNMIQESLYQFKGAWEHMFTSVLGKENGAIMTGIILGDKSQMDVSVKELYQTNGIGHILAISGLHISFIGLGVYQLLRNLGLSFKSAGSISVLLLSLYIAMIGPGVSSIRALTMLFIRILGDVLGRVYDIKTALAAAAVVSVIWRPLHLFDAGFLLSFGALAGIVYVYPVLKKTCPMKGRLWEGLIVSFSVNLILFPILLYFFFEFPIYSLLLNVIVIPLMSWIMGAGMIGSGVYLMWEWGGGKILQSCGAVFWIYEKSCEIVSRFPFARIIFGKPEIWQISVYYLGLLLLLLLLHIKDQKKWNPAGVAVAAALMISICVPGHGKRGYLDITMLDVGQGDAIFLRGPAGTTYLIDGGSTDVKEVGRYRIEPFLKSEGVAEIDYVFLSHGDADHINGIEELLTRRKVGVRIKTLVLPAQNEMDEELLRIARLAEKSGTTVLGINKGEQVMEDGNGTEMVFTCLHPEPEFTDESKNASSMVLSVETGEFRMLLTGDVEEEGERLLLEELDVQQYDILKVAHHGSKNSSIPELIEKTNPKIALISAGRKNRYGHPHEETIKKLEEAGSRIYSTQDSGAIQLRVPVSAKGKSL